MDMGCVTKGREKLKCGYTTGTCGAIAAKAAAQALFTGEAAESAGIITPGGIYVQVPVVCISRSASAVCCGVMKDGGDDPDATHGLYIHARVEKSGKGIIIDGGKGVGRVTKPGLDQPVGAAAINSTPRRMIAAALEEVCREHGYDGGLMVTIEVPDGEKTAKRTFNPHLGIVGGISILGTSGIVEPMSEKALIDSIEIEMRQISMQGHRDIIITPGNYGRDFLSRDRGYSKLPVVKCSNFIGEALDFAAVYGFKNVLLIGHIGKFIKLAGGIMNTHSKTADCRMELLALHGALKGAKPLVLTEILQSMTVDEGLSVLQRLGMMHEVMESLLKAAAAYVERRAGGSYGVGIVTFSNKLGLLGEIGRQPENWG